MITRLIAAAVALVALSTCVSAAAPSPLPPGPATVVRVAQAGHAEGTAKTAYFLGPEKAFEVTDVSGATVLTGRTGRAGAAGTPRTRPCVRSTCPRWTLRAATGSWSPARPPDDSRAERWHADARRLAARWADDTADEPTLHLYGTTALAHLELGDDDLVADVGRRLDAARGHAAADPFGAGASYTGGDANARMLASPRRPPCTAG